MFQYILLCRGVDPIGTPETINPLKALLKIKENYEDGVFAKEAKELVIVLVVTLLILVLVLVLMLPILVLLVLVMILALLVLVTSVYILLRLALENSFR